MKKIAITSALALIISGCSLNKNISQEVSETKVVYAIDSTTTMLEDMKNPGVFYWKKDTIRIKVVTLYNSRRNEFKTVYKILNK